MKNKLKLHLAISLLIMAAGVVLLLISLLDRDLKYLVWIAAALVLGSVVYKVITMKCPHCGAFLPVKYKLPANCAQCGKSLTEDVSR